MNEYELTMAVNTASKEINRLKKLLDVKEKELDRLVTKLNSPVIKGQTSLFEKEC